MQIELVETVKVGNTLGEGVIWDDRSQTVWWTDIQSFLLFRYDPIRKECTKYTTPERVCSFAFSKDQGWLIVAFETGFAHYNPEKNQTRWINRPYEHSTHIRMNDGRVDRQSRFWAGAMVENEKGQKKHSCLYRLDPSGEPATILEDIQISNSLCWSPDSKKLYFADSPTRRIDVFDFNASNGTVSNRKTFAVTSENIYPDGSIIDQDGYLWNAQWGGARVVRYAPDGTIDHILKMPVDQPTCVAFGGKDQSWLFITTARADLTDEKLDEQPQAGDLFIYKTDIKGIAEKHVDYQINTQKEN